MSLRTSDVMAAESQSLPRVRDGTQKETNGNEDGRGSY